MRTLVLLVLGGFLLYFAWSTFRTEDPTTEPAEGVESAEETGGGQLRSVAEMEAAVGAGGEKEVPREVPVEVQRDPDPDPEPEPERTGGVPLDEREIEDGGGDEPLSLAELGDPQREGSLLLHDPDGIPDYLKGAGEGLSKNRKQLLMAYALLVRGMHGLVPKYAQGLDQASDVTTEEYALLQSALDGRPIRARSAAHPTRQNPLVLGVSMALLARAGSGYIKEQRCQEASEAFSELILAELAAPWAPDTATLHEWSDRLHEAQACYRWRKDGSWPAVEVEVQDGDSLIAIRKRTLLERPEMLLCTGLIEHANQLGQFLRKGQLLRIPTAKPRVLVDLSARWLLYLHDDEVVGAWPVAVGTADTPTTPGHFTAGEKIPEPMWFPPGRGSVPYGDPRNPLGTRWITLDGSDGLGIHGTWEPETLGKAASDGCLRLRNDHVELLFEVLPKGSEVVLRP